MIKHPKEKGRRLEQHVTELIRGYGFKDAFRTPMSGAIKNVGLTADVTSKSFPCFIECKNQETTKFTKWYHKAENECGAKPPMIIWTKNKENIYSFMLLSDFLTIITNKPLQSIKKPTKPKQQSLEDTASFKFAKIKMNGRKK